MMVPPQFYRYKKIGKGIFLKYRDLIVTNRKCLVLYSYGLPHQKGINLFEGLLRMPLLAVSLCFWGLGF